MSKKYNQEILVNHFISSGFIYPSSEIYGGLSNSWDSGPLGVLIKNNLKKLWWDNFITKKENMVGIDSNIILNPNVWEASGHIDNFSDPLLDCKDCKSRIRADKLIEEFCKLEDLKVTINEQSSHEELEKIINHHKIPCPLCKKHNWTAIRNFNLLFETSSGILDSKKKSLYLRPETAQGIFINFKNIQRTTRLKLPFGVGQIGKSFRNEITPGNFIFRTKEFEQMEIEHFCESENEDEIFNKYIQEIQEFMVNILGIRSKLLKQISYPKEELAHYSNATTDFLFDFPHGWTELWGISNRGTYDLEVHQNLSKKSLEYQDPGNGIKLLPSVIEPSVGVERLLYAILINSYHEEKISDGDTRIVMKLEYSLCPYKMTILPLSNKLKEQSKLLLKQVLAKNISASFDSSGSIGKRYRRQDAIGTKYCITFDFETLIDEKITIRERDSMNQERVSIEEFLKNIENLK